MTSAPFKKNATADFLHGHVAKLREIRNTARQRIRILLIYLWRRLMIRTTVIAITGSTGKTTAKECLATILQGHGATLKTRQNENDQLGVPRTIRAIRPWHRFAVVEVGTGEPGDIARSARILKPDVAVILGVARTHTNKFPTLDDTATEKSALLKFVSRRGVAILNGDDARIAAKATQCRARVLLFGRSAGCDYRSLSVESNWPDRLRFTVEGPGGSVDVNTRLVGVHWIGSVLGALAAANVCGVPLAEAARRIGKVQPFMGRMQPVALPSGAIVMRDEENGSPDTLAAMVDVLRGSHARRRGLVMSDISDSRAKPRKRLQEIGRIAAEHCDFAAFIGDHACHAVKAAIAGGMDPVQCRDFVNPRNAAQWLKASLREGDLVFLKGRSTDHLTRVLFAQFGPIGCWKSSCNIRRVCDVCKQLRPEFNLEAALNLPLPVERSVPAKVQGH